MPLRFPSVLLSSKRVMSPWLCLHPKCKATPASIFQLLAHHPTVPILRGLSINFQAGKTAALVGASGSGLRSQIGLVSQESTLFATAIKGNVAYGLIGTIYYENASEEKKVCLDQGSCV